MLEVLRARAAEAAIALDTLHAAAEALPLPDASVALGVIADALHFLDAHRAGSELARVLTPDGTLAIVQVELGESPFMVAVQQLMQESAPRRPRRVDSAMTQLATLAGVKLELRQTFESVLPATIEQVERILRSISFIGPAMNPERFATFSTRLRAIAHAPVWHTTLRLWAGRRADVRPPL
jgi:ubiquinone/menaquinone biosynthesis C-methylase UbiE